MALITIDGKQRHTSDTLGEPLVGPTDKAAVYQKHPIPGQEQLPLLAAGMDNVPELARRVREVHGL